MQEAGTKLVDGQQQQHLAMKLNFLKTMWGIFPQSTLLQQTCKSSMKFWCALLRSRMHFLTEECSSCAWSSSLCWGRKHPDIVLKMGVFHRICTLLSILGKHFQDAGLRDICIESGEIVEGSVSGALDGHRYNPAIWFHKRMHEALQKLA